MKLVNFNPKIKIDKDLTSLDVMLSYFYNGWVDSESKTAYFWKLLTCELNQN